MAKHKTEALEYTGWGQRLIGTLPEGSKSVRKVHAAVTIQPHIWTQAKPNSSVQRTTRPKVRTWKRVLTKISSLHAYIFSAP